MGSVWEWMGWGVAVAVATWAVAACARAAEWVWFRPKRVERCLREQGLKGTPYKFLFGDLKEEMKLKEEARAKPLTVTHDIMPRVAPFLLQNMNRYGKMSFSWFGPYARVTIMDPELVKEVLSTKVDQIGRYRIGAIVKLFVLGLVTLEGKKWAMHRRIISPAFHLEKLKLMLPAFSTSCYNMVSRWENMVSAEKPMELDVWSELQILTADVISRSAFGSSYEEGNRIFQLQTEQAKLLSKSICSLLIPGYRFLPTTDNRKMRYIYKEVRMILREIIEKREKAMNLGETTNVDLLGLLLESNSKQSQEHKSSNAGMTIDDVIEECKLFYFAGQETSASLLAYTMIALSMHPDWQARAREEVMQIYGKNKPDFDGLSHLKIVTMILNEVLRMYPPVISLFRCTNKDIEVGGINFPGGVEFVLPVMSIHRDEEFWGEDAKEFKPERFVEGISKACKSQFAFFPFSGGPRTCLGNNFAMMEVKIAMAMILQRFSFVLSQSFVHAPYSFVTLQPQHGALIMLQRL